MKNRTDLNLCEVVYVSIIYHVPDSWLNLLNGYDFYFWWRDSENQQFLKKPKQPDQIKFNALVKRDLSSAIAEHVRATGHNIKWDHFDILGSGKSDLHCKIKETLFIQELKPSLNVNISSEKLLLFS
jgi:hypothetical protein